MSNWSRNSEEAEKKNYPSFGHPLCKGCKYDKNYFHCAMSKKFHWLENDIPPLVDRRFSCRYLAWMYAWRLTARPKDVLTTLTI